MSTPDTAALLEQVRDFGESIPEGARILIVPHDYPDPDALAAAAGLHLLLQDHFHRPSQIAFSGEVSRAENLEFLRHLRFRWHRVPDLRATARPTVCIFVDTAPWSRNVTIPPRSRPVAVFDHHKHKPSTRENLPFLYIRPGAGATTTLVYEFLKAAQVSIPPWLAALMAYALASETLDLSREAGESEHKAYVELAARADLRILGRIRHARLPAHYFAHLQDALSAALRREDVVWTHLSGATRPEIVAEIADLLLRMEGMRWSFCTADMGDRLQISMRSRHRAARCSQILRRALGKRGSSGGHHAMAAGFVEYPASASAEDRAQILSEVTQSLLRKLPIGKRMETGSLIQGEKLVARPAAR